MDNMEFPKYPVDFIDMYSFKDTKEEYTNGSELIPVFRVKQLIDHYYLKPEQEFLGDIEAKVQALEAENAAIKEHNKALQHQNEFLLRQVEFVTDLHTKAVDRVNKVTFAKLKVENQLELLQNVVGAVLARFQVDTEEDDHE